MKSLTGDLLALVLRYLPDDEILQFRFVLVDLTTKLGYRWMSLVRWTIQTETQLMQIPDSAKRWIRELIWRPDSLQKLTAFINITVLHLESYDGPELAALSALVSFTYLYLRNYVGSVDVDILCRSRPDIKIHFFSSIPT
jgi:hypothetical protein